MHRHACDTRRAAPPLPPHSCLPAAAGAQTYKGTIVDLEQAQPPPEATLWEKEGYDPWESVVVQWDRGALPARPRRPWKEGT